MRLAPIALFAMALISIAFVSIAGPRDARADDAPAEAAPSEVAPAADVAGLGELKLGPLGSVDSARAPGRWVAPMPDAAAARQRRRTAAELEEAIAADDDKADGWAVEDMHWALGGFYQNGLGLQSRAKATTFTHTYDRTRPNERGIEEAYILEPQLLINLRQNKHFRHEIYLPVDIVSAASPDGVDLVATASRANESFTVDVTSTYQTSELLDFSFRYGFHAEEPLRSFDAGPSLTFHLAENNTVVTLSALIVSDGFDPLALNGKDLGYTSRSTFSGNLSISQILSPTTLFDASIGTTEQWGTLSTGWNSVPVRNPPGEPGDLYTRTVERFPMSRNRDAIFARISQHIPATHTTIKGSYRFYWDENHSTAHTGEVMIFQYLTPWLYVRAHGRLHQQKAPIFWTTYLQAPFKETTWRTSDSDLETLVSREAGLKLVLLRDKVGKSWRGPDSFDVSYLRYQRSNSLHADFVSLGYARTF